MDKDERRNGIKWLGFDEEVVRIGTPRLIEKIAGRELSEDAKYQLALEVVEEMISELSPTENPSS